MKALYKFLIYIILTVILTFTNSEKLFAQYTISGYIYFSDNGDPVTTGNVYLLVYNPIIGYETLIDSVTLSQNGNFELTTSYSDSVLVCSGWIQIPPFADHVTTYYPSTINWENAQPVYPPDNPTNINIAVTRINPDDDNLSLSGIVTTLDSNSNIVPVPNVIVVAKQNNIYKYAAYTDSSGNYLLDSLSFGACTILANKIGFAQDSTSVLVSGNNVNSSVHLQMKKVTVKKRNHSNQSVNKFYLSQNYPNPFNPCTKIQFNIPNSAISGLIVKLTIYDITGKEVTTLVNEYLKPGTYEITWDASQYSSGVYFYEIKTNNFRNVKKMILVK